MDSNNGSPIVRPVTATRMGAWALPSLRPCFSPTASRTAFRSSAFHSATVASSARASDRMSPAPAFIALFHDASSSTGSSRNRKST